MADNSKVSSVIGIDLGSLNCRCAELLVNRRMPVTVRSKLSNESTPSVTYLPAVGDGERQFGEAVATKDITSATHTVANLKEWLLSRPTEPRSFPSLITKGEATELKVAQVLGFTLRQILENASTYTKYKAGSDGLGAVVLSIPTFYVGNKEVEEAIHQAVSLCCEREGAPIPVKIFDEADALAAYFHHLRYDSHEESIATVIVNVGHKHTTLVAVKAVKGTVQRIASTSAPTGSSSIDEGLCDFVFDHILKKQGRDIKSDPKSYKKVLRECKKAKEILSSVDTAMVQLEGLAQDTDVSVQITRAQVVECGAKLAQTISDGLQTIISAVSAELEAGTVRLECVGGGWRSPFVQDQLKSALKVNRVGVSLDSNLCVAEGCAVLGAIGLIAQSTEEERNIFDSVHSVSMIPEPISSESAEVSVPPEWRQTETALKESDAKFIAFSSAVDQLQSLIFSTQSLLGRCGNVSEDTYSSLNKLLDEIDALASDESTTVEVLKDTYASMAAKVNAIPEVAAQKEKEAAEEKRKEEEFIRLSKLQEEDKELTNDPQRLRVAQQRREQGTTLFKQECWEEAQTRFVQALSILGSIYDTNNEEYKAKKNEISLSCHLNIASCCVKLSRWRIAISNCSNALDISPNNPKALFRRGQAYSAQGDFKEALADLTLAAKLTNNDGGVMAELEHLQKKMEHEKAKEKKMYGKMFA